MQPSGPNRPNELPSPQVPRRPQRRHRTQHQAAHQHTHTPFPEPPSQDPAGWPGGHRKVATPDPIPNSAVKHLSAHGTAAPEAGESVAAGPPSRIPGPHTTPVTPNP